MLKPSSGTIAFVLPDLGGGGAQKVMLQIAGRLQARGLAARLIVLGGSRTFADRVPSGLPIEIGQADRMRDGLPWLVRRLRVLKPEAVVSVMGYLNLALLGCRWLLPASTRIIVREANTIAATSAALPRWLPGDMLYRQLYRRADAIVCPTRSIANELTSRAPETAALTHVISNPVDIEGLRRLAAEPTRVPGDGPRLVFVGRLTKQKGLDRLVEILPSLPPNAHVAIYGSGPEQERLQQRIDALQQCSRVTFHGFSDTVMPWIAGADALLLPSRWEGLPNVVLESLAVGTPVIASEEAGVGELATTVSPAALCVTTVEAGFVDSVSRLQPHTGTGLRPCLLPDDYRADIVSGRWQALIEDLLLTAPPGDR